MRRGKKTRSNKGQFKGALAWEQKAVIAKTEAKNLQMQSRVAELKPFLDKQPNLVTALGLFKGQKTVSKRAIRKISSHAIAILSTEGLITGVKGGTHVELTSVGKILLAGLRT